MVVFLIQFLIRFLRFTAAVKEHIHFAEVFVNMWKFYQFF